MIVAEAMSTTPLSGVRMLKTSLAGSGIFGMLTIRPSGKCFGDSDEIRAIGNEKTSDHFPLLGKLTLRWEYFN